MINLYKSVYNYNYIERESHGYIIHPAVIIHLYLQLYKEVRSSYRSTFVHHTVE